MINISKLKVAIATIIFIVSCKVRNQTFTAESIAPTDIQLNAIKMNYPNIMMQDLINGHAIYIGVCTDCHGMKNIYTRDEKQWKYEVDRMASRSKLTHKQKEELYQYILSMIASHSSENK
ncbi:MAG: hypothetical protein ACK504_00645 [Bacteroidota bacterium]